MAWARIDDRFCWHRKVLAAGNEAAGAYVRMIAYACLEGTDGLIAAGTAMLIAVTPAVLDKLVAAVLLERLESGDFMIHDFLDYNPPAAEVRAKREATIAQRSAAGKRSAEVRWGNRSKNGAGNDVRNETSNEPLPSSFNGTGNETVTPSPSPSPIPYPIPNRERESTSTPSQSSGNDAETSAPMAADARLPEEARASAAMLGVRDIDDEWKKFRAIHIAKNTVATARGFSTLFTDKWCVDAKKYQARERDRRGPPPAPPRPPVRIKPLPPAMTAEEKRERNEAADREFEKLTKAIGNPAAPRPTSNGGIQYAKSPREELEGTK